MILYPILLTSNNTGTNPYPDVFVLNHLFQVLATDKDINENAEVKYSLAEFNDYFEIGITDGVVRTKGILQTRKYQFDIIAEDQGTKPRKTTGR